MSMSGNDSNPTLSPVGSFAEDANERHWQLLVLLSALAWHADERKIRTPGLSLVRSLGLNANERHLPGFSERSFSVY